MHTLPGVKDPFSLALPMYNDSPEEVFPPIIAPCGIVEPVVVTQRTRSAGAQHT